MLVHLDWEKLPLIYSFEKFWMVSFLNKIKLYFRLLTSFSKASWKLLLFESTSWYFIIRKNLLNFQKTKTIAKNMTNYDVFFIAKYIGHMTILFFFFKLTNNQTKLLFLNEKKQQQKFFIKSEFKEIYLLLFLVLRRCLRFADFISF